MLCSLVQSWTSYTRGKKVLFVVILFLFSIVMFDKVEAAYERIKQYVNKTPVMTSTTLNEKLGCKCYFKCENFQKIGAFKFRGALNTVLQLSEQERKRGIITHSSGNHAQALALAAKITGIKAVIVMPAIKL